VPPPPTGEGKASVYEVNLPSDLKAGSSITGTVKIQNIGAVEDDLRILITTEWDSKKYQASGSVPVNWVLTATIAEGVMVMPDIDAIMTIEAQHLEAGVWVTDDTRTH